MLIDQQEEQQDTNKYLVALFLRSDKSQEFSLNAFHRLTLRVIADYCDMQLKYCCVKQANLAIECGMSVREIKRTLKFLSDKKLLYITAKGKLNRYRVGEIITGDANE